MDQNAIAAEKWKAGKSFQTEVVRKQSKQK